MADRIIKIIQVIVYTNLWIGIGAAVITWQYYLIYNLPVNFYIIFLAFFATVLTYTFQRYVKLLNQTHGGGERLAWMKKHPLLVKGILVVGLVGCIVFLMKVSWVTYIYLVIAGLMSLFYVIKIPGVSGKSLRDIPTLKIFIIAVVWAATGTFLPWLNTDHYPNELPWLLFLIYFLFILAITLPFDIRDIYLDDADKKTIPQRIGEGKTRFLSVVLLALHLFLFSLVFDQWPALYTFFTAFAIFLILRSKSDTNDLYFSFVIDGLLILQGLIIYYDRLFYL
jgi:hypothetical protein